MKIRIIIFDGVDELDFVGPYEVFKQVAAHGGEIDVALVTLDSMRKIKGQNGLTVYPEGMLTKDADMIVVPGGGWVNESANGIRCEIAKGTILKVISEHYKRGTILLGVCTGVMALAEAGLLEGRPATTHHGAMKDLQSKVGKVVESRVVDDGKIITCGGVTSSLDLSIWVVKRFWGKEMSQKIAQYLEYNPEPNIYSTSEF